MKEPANLASSAVDPKIVGIGGWLVLSAIGFVIGPIMSVAGLIFMTSAGYGVIYALELVAEVSLQAFVLYAAVRLFGKKANAPSVIITLFLVSLGSAIVLFVIEAGAGAERLAIETGKQIVRDVIGAAIWIPCFHVSRRVKATFVN